MTTKFKIGKVYKSLDKNKLTYSKYVYIGKFTVGFSLKYRFVDLDRAIKTHFGYTFCSHSSLFLDVNKVELLPDKEASSYNVKLKREDGTVGKLIEIEKHELKMVTGNVYGFKRHKFHDKPELNLVLVNRTYDENKKSNTYSLIGVKDLVEIDKIEGGFTFDNCNLKKFYEEELHRLYEIKDIKYKVIKENLPYNDLVKLILKDPNYNEVNASELKIGCIYLINDIKYVLLEEFKDSQNYTCRRFVELEYFQTLEGNITSDSLQEEFIKEYYKLEDIKMELCDDDAPFKIEKERVTKYTFREMQPKYIKIYE